MFTELSVKGDTIHQSVIPQGCLPLCLWRHIDTRSWGDCWRLMSHRRKKQETHVKVWHLIGWAEKKKRGPVHAQCVTLGVCSATFRNLQAGEFKPHHFTCFLATALPEIMNWCFKLKVWPCSFHEKRVGLRVCTWCCGHYVLIKESHILICM